MQSIGSGAGKLSKQVIIVLVVVLVAGGGVGGYLMQAKGKEAAAEEQEGGAETEIAPEGLETHLVDLGEFLVNVSDGAKMRYLRTQVAMEIAALGEAAEQNRGGGHGGHDAKEEGYELPQEALLRAKDVVVKQLTACQFQSLRAEEGRDELKERLAAALDTALDEYEVHAVLFVSFVMQ